MNLFEQLAALSVEELEEKRSLLMKKMYHARMAMVSDAILEAMENQFDMIQTELTDRATAEFMKEFNQKLSEPIYSHPDKLKSNEPKKKNRFQRKSAEEGAVDTGITIPKAFQKNYKK